MTNDWCMYLFFVGVVIVGMCCVGLYSALERRNHIGVQRRKGVNGSARLNWKYEGVASTFINDDNFVDITDKSPVLEKGHTYHVIYSGSLSGSVFKIRIMQGDTVVLYELCEGSVISSEPDNKIQVLGDGGRVVLQAAVVESGDLIVVKGIGLEVREIDG